MRYDARVTAFDMLDQVHVSVLIYGCGDEHPHVMEKVGHYTTTVQGTGESDPYRWTRDALVAALECL